MFINYKKYTFILGFISLFISSEGRSSSLQTRAPVAFVVDVTNNQILMEKHADIPIAPASMTKIMTAYVIFDLISQKKISLEQLITVPPAVWERWHGRRGGATMFLRANEVVSVENLLKGMLTVSGNDATYTLAASVPGGVNAFVKLMNDKANDIGLKSSHFSSPNGWEDNDTTVTTARDLALLSRITIEQFPKFYKNFYAQKEMSWGLSPDGHEIHQYNKNPLLGIIPHADGLKTGFTENAGYCFTGSATKNGHRIIMVIAGLSSARARSDEAKHLMAESLRDIP